MADVYEQIGAIDNEIGGLVSRLGELNARRAELTGTLGANGLMGADVSLEWLPDQYALNQTALGELGFSKKVLETEVPSLEQVRDGLEPHAAWLNGQRVAGTHRRLVIAPRVQDIGLIGTRRAPGLITRFDKKQNGVNTYVWSDLWGQYGDKDPIHDNGATEAWPTAVLLGDTTDPRDASKKANDYEEPGLVFVNMNVDDQRAALAAEARIQAVVNRELRPSVIADIVVANAQRRLEGKPLLDQRTFTRLTHYPDRVAVGVAHVPDVRSDGSKLRLDGSVVSLAWGSIGVRRGLKFV